MARSSRPSSLPPQPPRERARHRRRRLTVTHLKQAAHQIEGATTWEGVFEIVADCGASPALGPAMLAWAADTAMQGPRAVTWDLVKPLQRLLTAAPALREDPASERLRLTLDVWLTGRPWRGLVLPHDPIGENKALLQCLHPCVDLRFALGGLTHSWWTDAIRIAKQGRSSRMGWERLVAAEPTITDQSLSLIFTNKKEGLASPTALLWSVLPLAEFTGDTLRTFGLRPAARRGWGSARLLASTVVQEQIQRILTNPNPLDDAIPFAIAIELKTLKRAPDWRERLERLEAAIALIAQRKTLSHLWWKKKLFPTATPSIENVIEALAPSQLREVLVSHIKKWLSDPDLTIREAAVRAIGRSQLRQEHNADLTTLESTTRPAPDAARS